jgi:hypothetical protein
MHQERTLMKMVKPATDENPPVFEKEKITRPIEPSVTSVMPDGEHVAPLYLAQL